MNLTTILRTAKAALSSSSVSNLATTTSSSRKPRFFTSTLLVLSFVFSLLRVESGWGQVSLPYSENFGSISAANGFPVVTGGAWTRTASTAIQPTYVTNQASYNRVGRNDTKFMSFRYTAGTNVYCVGPFNLTAGVSYTVGNWYVTDGLSGWTTYKLTYGTGTTVALQPNTIASVSSPTNSSYNQLTGAFTPATTGSYYIGMCMTSTSAPWYFSVDDFSINLTPPPPTIASISPTSGCPGSSITITGTNFTGATAGNVKIGGTPVSSITSNTGTAITAVVGAGTTGTVTVTTSSTATSSGTFTFLSAPPAPVTNAAGSITTSSASVSWAASAGATSYRLDVATDAAFTAMVTGFNDLNVGNATSYSITGLTANSTYYYRVRGNNGSCSGGSSSAISFFTGFVVPATGSNSYTSCSGNIYDPGILGDYPNNANGFTTIYPGTPGSFVKLTFNFLTVETCCDYIKIYNGNSTAAPLIGQYTTSPGVIQSTALDGSLTIQFVSDGSVVYAGFDASISCVAPCSGTPSVGDAVTWSPTAVTGFNADVIANGVGAASSSSSQFDAGGFALVSADFQSSTASTLPTYSLPITGIVNSSSNAGVNYQLANYTGNNSLRLVGATSGLLTLVNTNKAKRVAILTSSGSGTSVFTAQINFSDGTNEIFASNSVQDWYGSTYSIAPIGRVPLTTGIPEGTSTQPGLYDVILTLSAANQSKTITSVLFTKTDAVASALNILGISLSTNTPTTVLCNGQSRILSLPDLNSTIPGLTYQWQTSSSLTGPWSNITGATTTTYTTPALTTAGIVYYKCVVTCTNSVSSASSTPIAINVNPTFIINPSSGAVCLGSSLQAIPSSNSTYLWSNNATTSSISVTGAGTYSVLISNNGCVSKPSATVTLLPNPTVVSTGSVNAVCTSSSSQTSIFSYSASINSPTSYSIDWNAAANSAGIADVSTTSYSFLAGGGSFSVSIGANVPPGVYNGTLSFTNANGCLGTTTISITITPLPTLSGISQVASLCYTTQNGNTNASIQLTGLLNSTSQTATYNINGGSSQTIAFTSSASGTATLSIPVTTANHNQSLTITSINCANFTSNNSCVLSVIQAPNAPIVLPLTQTVNVGASATFTGSRSASTNTLTWWTATSGGTEIDPDGPAFNVDSIFNSYDAVILPSTSIDFCTPGLTSSTTTHKYYVQQYDGVCPSARTEVVVTTNNLFSNTPSNLLICQTGGSVTLQANITPLATQSFQWLSSTTGTPASNATGSSTSSIYTANPSVTTNYALSTNLTPFGCSTPLNTSQMFAVGVLPANSFIPTATPSTLCIGGTSTLAANLSSSGFSVTSIPIAMATSTSPVPLVTNGTINVALASGSLDDGGWSSIPLGFNYNFFGNTYSSVNVGTNGLIQFGAYNSNNGFTAPYGLGDYTFANSLPTTLEPMNVVAAAANDYYCYSGLVRYWTYGMAPTRVFVIEWNGVPGFITNGSMTTQIKLFETTGIVEVHVLNASSTNTKVVGLQNADASIGSTAYSSANAITNQAWKFVPGAAYTYQWYTGTNTNSPISGATSGTYTTTSAQSATAGQKTYTVAATNPITGCASTQPATITVNALPSAPISGGNVTACNNAASTTLTATAPVGCVVEWFSNSTGTGTPLATGSNYTFTPSAVAGTYTYYAFSRNSTTTCASSAGTAILLTVVTSPDAPIATTTAFTYCEGSTSTQLAASALSGNTLSWYSGTLGVNPSSSAPTPSTATNVGSPFTFYATQTSGTNGCESNPTTFTVTVNNTPAAPVYANTVTGSGLGYTINPQGTITYCQGATTYPIWSSGSAANVLNNTNNNQIYWYYSAPSGNAGQTSTPTNPSSVNPGSTTYYVSRQNTVTGCEGARVPVIVVINPSLTASVAISASSTTVCPGGSITYNAVPTNGGPAPSYAWFVNGSQVGTGSTYTQVAPVNGDAIYATMISNEPSCLFTPNATSSTITLNNSTVTPSVSIIQNTNTTICANSSVTFSVANALNMGATPTYAWKVNGTTVGTAATYTSTTLANNDIVTLMMTSSLPNNCLTGGVATATSAGITMTVTPVTAITAQPSNASVCLGGAQSLAVSAVGTGTITYQWQSASTVVGPFTNISFASNTSSQSSTLLIPSVAGQLSYQLVATSSCGTATSSIATISINQATGITAQPQAVVACDGTTATFNVTAVGTGTISYQWRFNGSPITGATSASYSILAISLANAGQYSVVVSATCGSVTSTNAQLTVNPLTAISSQPVNASICDSTLLSLSVSASGTAPISYQWQFNGTPISGATSALYSDATATVVESGLYTVVVSGGCSNLTSSAATVVISPNTWITAQPVSYTGCALNPTSISVTALGANLQYQWLIGSNPANLTAITGATGATLNMSNPQTSNSGTYRVSVSGICGLDTSDIALITINPVPPAGTINGGNSGVCVGSTINLTNLASGGVWTSSNPAMGSISSTGVLTGISAGTITVTYTVTNSFGCVSTATKVIQVKGLPTALIQTPLATSICQGESMNLQSSAAVAYAWSNGGTTQNIAVNSSAIGTSNYTVIVTGTNGCTATSAPLAITVIPVPTIAAITGSGNFPNFCLGNTSNLSNATPNGLWSSSNTNVLTVNPLSGSANALTIGTATVSYHVANIPGCLNPNPGTATATITVSTPPSAYITSNGSTTFCQGGSVLLSAPSGTGYNYLWSNGATTQTVTATTSGSYTVTVTATGGCSVTSLPTTVNVLPIPTATIYPTGAINICSGTNVTLSTGSAVSYAWSNGANTPTISVNAAGTFSVTLTGTNGCTATSAVSTVSVTQVPSAVITANGPTNICDGGSVGLSVPTAQSYLWSNGSTTQAISATSTGNYSVTATNGICSATSTPIYVNFNPVPSSVITTSGPTTFCQGGNVTLSAPTGNSYTYLWTNGATTQSIDVASSGSYGVTVSNSFNCSSTSTPISVVVNALPTASITAAGSTTICSGNSLSLTAAGANAYLWSTGATTQSINVSIAGNYTVQAISAAGCTATSTALALTVLPSPTAVITQASGTTFCQGGSVSMSSTPASAYLWSNNATTQSISATTTGAYNVLVTAANGCTATSNTINVNVLPIPSAVIYPGTNVNICAGSTVTLSTGTAASYAWSNGANTPTITVGANGTHTVTLTGSNGCTATSAITTVTVNPIPVATITAAGSTNICSGTSVTLSAPTADTYLWSNGATTQNIAASLAGSYTVTVTTAGCSATSAATSVNVNPAPTAVVTASGPTSFCQGGSVSFTANAGNGYSYLWNDGSTTASITATSSGNYSVTVTNQIGCSTTSVVNAVVVNPIPTATITAGGSTTICSGSPVSLSAPAGGTYLWSNGATSQSINASIAGAYTVTVSSLAGCSATSTPTTIVVNALPSAAISSSGSTTFCQGGSVSLSAASGLSAYLWNTGATTASLNASTSGNYSVTVTNSNGCSATSSPTVVNVLSAPSAVIYPGTNVNICAGSTVTLSTGTAASYAWSNGANTPTITVGANGTHTVTLTGSNGCTATSAITTVTVNPIPVATITAAGSTNICSGTSVTLSAPTANTYLWSNGATTQTIAASLAGSYTVTITTAGCSATSAATSVNVNPAPTAVVTASGPTSFCQGGSVSFTANAGNGFSYLWNTGATTAGITANTSGNYSVTVTNQIGCSTTSVVNAVVVNPIPTATITAGGATTICSGTSVALNASAGATYLWSNGATTQSINASNAGNYTVSVTSAAGCSATSNPTTISLNSLPSASISSSGSTTFCQGGSVSLSGTSGMTSYLWSTGATGSTINATTSGNYTVTVTDANGCSATSTPTAVTVNQGPVAQIYPGTNLTICSGSNVTLSTNSASSYTWSNGSHSATIQVNTAGTYSVVLTGSNGCSSTSPVTTVVVTQTPSATITSSGPTTICQGSSVTLSAPASASSYLWNNGATTQSITATLVGSYYVTVGSNGCSATSPSTFVSYNPVPSAAVTASGPTTFCQGNSVTFSAPAGNGNTYVWNTGATTQSVSTSTAGNFSVTVTNGYGCSATSTTSSVLVNPLPVVTPITGSSSICAGTQGQVSNVMTGGVYASSNLGVASIGQLNGQITGLTAGTTTISYVYTNANGCSNTVTYPVTINAAPVATITANGPTTFCQGGSVGLTASSGTAYLWNTGATTATITATTAGSYSVTVTGANGCSATSLATTVNILTPSPVSAINGASSVCVNSATALTNATSGGVWTSSTPAVATISAAGIVTGVSAGSTTISYTINSTNGCQNTATKVVTVNAVPSTALTASGATTFCQGGNVQLTASAGATYAWSNGATTSSITATTAGTYNVTVTDANGCSSVSTNQTITVNALPTAQISTNGSTNLCTGGSITLMATPSASYLWSTGATTSSITTSTAGTYTVVVTNANGCSATSTATNVVVNASPSATVTASGPTTICSGNNVVLTAASVIGNAYQWMNNGVLISGATSNALTATASGSYAVIVTNAYGCTATSVATPVTVVLASTSNITASGTTSLCNNASVTLTASSGASYLWSNGATTQAITVNTAANYTVTVTNALGCSATSVATPVIVNASPAATITAGGPTTFCQGSNVVLTASAGATYLWSNGATTAAITATTPGTYSVFITNASGCSATSAGTAITVNAAPVANITAGGATTFCSGGSVTLTASAGTSYLWSTGATTASITATTAGSRTVTVTNAAGCSTTSAPINIVVNTMPTATITAGGPTSICSGSNVTLTASGGSTYVWNNGATTASIVANTSGNYSVTVYNANGCSAISTPTTVTVNNPSVANVSTSGPTTFCQGGSVNLTATTAASYAWSNGATTQSISVNTSGNYSVLLTNASGCTSTSPVIAVTANALPTATITAGGSTTFCQGGSVTLTASPATSYLWSNGATGSSINVTTAGNYTVQIANNSGCTANSTATTVTVNALPVATITAGGSLSICAGSSVNLTASTGTAYLWSNGATTATIAASNAGNYTVQVSNAAGCTSTSAVSSVVVNALPTPSVTSVGSTTICQGASVTLTTANGSGLTYQWKNNGTNISGATAASYVASTAGNYTVQVTNAAGCSGTSTATTVTVNALPVASISNSGSNTICSGSSVNLTASTGTAYAWSNGATAATIAVNATGNYSVIVTNAAGCTSSAATTITVVTPTVASISANGPTSFCTGQNVVLTANTGASYLWSTGATTASITVATTSNISVQVTYASGCVSTSPTTAVNVNALPVASITASGATSFCPGSSVTLTASNGSSYVWTNGATTNSIVVSSAGSYGVTVANAAGCSSVAAPTSIVVFAAPTATITPSAATTFCQGASINLTANAAAGYAWSNGASTSSISVNNSGNFTVMVTDANGCSAISSVVPVTVNAVPVASIQANGPTTVCQGTSVVLTANGGTGFAWSNSETTASITVNATGSYGVTVTNAAGCSSVVTPVSITVNPVQVLSPIVGATNVCVGSSTTYTNSTSGGTWSSDNTAVAAVNATNGIVSGISTGSATIKYQFVNASGCTSEVIKVVTVNGIQPVSIAASGSTTFCQGGTVTLTAPAGLNYNWTNGATTQSITVNASGIYGITASNVAGCSTTSSTVAVTVNPAPVASISSSSTALCQGSNLVLNAPANATTYAWSNGATTQNVLITAPGVYSLTLTDANGCSASASTTIVNGINPVATIAAGGATTFCSGGSVVLNAAGGTSFLWNNGATTQNITVNTPGNYSVMVTNAAGCSAMSNATMVNVLQSPNAVATAYGPTTFCQGGSVTIATSGGATYAWSNGSTAQSILPTTSGTYSVVVTAANGCTATSNAINVTVNPTPTAVITPSGATTFCEGSSVNLVASGGSNYAWSNGPNTSSITVTTGGTYTVTVTNAGGCTDTETINVTVNEVPSAFIVTSGATTFCQGGQVNLTAQAGNSYLWSNNATTQSISVASAGTYSVTILSPNGCSVSSNAISVTVNQPSASSLNATAFDSYTLNGILYTQSGTYTQNLTNAAGCDSTITLNLTLTVGIEEGTLTDVNLYPNPTSESFTIKTTVPVYGMYSVVDAQGKLVFEGELTGTETQVNISSVARGIYYLRIPELSEPLRVVKN